MRLPALLSALALMLCGSLQLAAQRPESETGSVTGRVLCADTNGPARMASVVLVPIFDTSFLPKPGSPKDAEPPREPVTRIVETGLDGTFVVPKVRPGNYYVVAQKNGYLQPLSLVTREQMNKPDDATIKLIARLMTPATVVANRGTQVEARLFRGGAVSGTVRYDDGSPLIGSSVGVYSKDKSGKWIAYNGRPVSGSGSMETDDLGRYRLSGLPAGEYLVRTSLNLEDVIVNHVFGGVTSAWSSTRYSLDLFYGNTYRTHDAKPVKLGEGEEAGGLDMTVRLQEMHGLSGTVVQAGGQPVNAAKVALLWNDDDKTQFVSTQVRAEDNAFHFDYVPEGEYTLRVTEAREVARTELPNCPQCVPPTHTEEKTIRNFGNAEQPLVLHTDMQAISVTVPATPAGSSK